MKRRVERSAEYVTVCGDVAHVELSQGAVAVVDAADAAEVGTKLWHLQHDGYAVRNIRINGKWTVQRLHRFLLDPPPGMYIDHINGDGLDNRRSNLRFCSHSENQRNRKPMAEYRGRLVTCGYKGVCIRKARFRAQIKLNGKKIALGSFDTAESAARAYDAAARTHFGQYARTNF